MRSWGEIDYPGIRTLVRDGGLDTTYGYDAATLQLDKENLDAIFYDGMALTRAYEDGTETNGPSGRGRGG